MVLESAWTSWLILAHGAFCSCWLHLMKRVCFSTFCVDWVPTKVLAEGTAFNFSVLVFELPELRWKLCDFSRALSLNWYLPKEFCWVCKDSWPHVRAPYQTKTDYATFWICWGMLNCPPCVVEVADRCVSDRLDMILALDVKLWLITFCWFRSSLKLFVCSKLACLELTISTDLRISSNTLNTSVALAFKSINAQMSLIFTFYAICLWILSISFLLCWTSDFNVSIAII